MAPQAPACRDRLDGSSMGAINGVEQVAALTKCPSKYVYTSLLMQNLRRRERSEENSIHDSSKAFMIVLKDEWQ